MEEIKRYGIYWIGYRLRIVKFWIEERQITPKLSVMLYYAKCSNLENYTALLRWISKKEARKHLVWSLRFLYKDDKSQSNIRRSNWYR